MTTDSTPDLSGPSASVWSSNGQITAGNGRVTVHGDQTFNFYAATGTMPELHRRTAIGKSLYRWGPAELGVHVSIDGTWLVPYVERRHDGKVRAALAQALLGEDTRMVIVRGDSCTGKTRCILEAVRAQQPELPLIRPAGPEGLKAVLDADVGSGAVIWLDEIDRFLRGTNSTPLAERLLDGLADDHGLVFVGTIWTDTWRRLTARPGTNRAAPIRRLLETVIVIDVPPIFVPSDLDRARIAFGPQFQDTVRAAADSGELVQNLAGGPQLVELFETAEPYLSAVLAAAMDLHRIGFTAPVPRATLKAAAYGQLSPRHRARRPDGWFHTALNRATKPVKATVSAVEPARSGPDGYGPDGYVLADYLQQYANRCRSTISIRPELWAIASAGAPDWPTAQSLAAEAQLRDDTCVVHGLLRRTVELGGVGAWAEIASRAADTGDLSVLDELTAVAQTNPGAMLGYPGFLWFEIALLHYSTGASEHAEAALARAGEDFIDWAAIALAREKCGDSRGAEAAAQRDYEETSYRDAWLNHLIQHRLLAGDIAGAERAADAMTATGDPYGWAEIGNDLFGKRDFAGAERAYRRAAELGNGSSWIEVGRTLVKLGDDDAAEAAFLQATEAGIDEPCYAWEELAALRERRGNITDAETAAARSFGLGWVRIAVIREARGDRAGAEAAAEAESRTGAGWARLAEMRERAGDRRGAEAAARRSAPFDRHGIFGSSDGWRRIIDLRCALGDWAAALEACRQYGTADDRHAQVLHTEVCERAGHVGEAAAMAERCAAAGDLGAWQRIAAVRAEGGDDEIGFRLSRFGVNFDGSLRDGPRNP